MKCCFKKDGPAILQLIFCIVFSGNIDLEIWKYRPWNMEISTLKYPKDFITMEISTLKTKKARFFVGISPTLFEGSQMGRYLTGQRIHSTSWNIFTAFEPPKMEVWMENDVGMKINNIWKHHLVSRFKMFIFRGIWFMYPGWLCQSHWPWSNWSNHVMRLSLSNHSVSSLEFGTPCCWIYNLHPRNLTNWYQHGCHV